MKCVLMAEDKTFYKSEYTRHGATLEESHVFQNEKQAKKVKDSLDKCYAETTYTIKQVKIEIL